jgi:hypothetical protein
MKLLESAIEDFLDDSQQAKASLVLPSLRKYLVHGLTEVDTGLYEGHPCIIVSVDQANLDGTPVQERLPDYINGVLIGYQFNQSE